MFPSHDRGGNVVAAGGSSNLLSNGDFASGDFTSWTTRANDPGSNSPTVETFSPQSGSYDQSAPAGANNYYVEGANGDDSTTESGLTQTVNCSASTAFTFSAKIGGRFSDDGCYVEAKFKTSGDVDVAMGNNYSLLCGDFTDSTKNGTYIKTSLRGIIDYDSGYKFKTGGSNDDYPVYKISDTMLIIKNKAFSSDRWSFYEGVTWDIDDLVNDFDIGTGSGTDYTETIISTSGDDSHAGDSLKYPPISESELYRYSDGMIIGMNAELRYRANGGNFNSSSLIVTGKHHQKY